MMTFLHGYDRIYNNIFIQNWPVKPLEIKEDMGFVMFDNQVQGTDVFDDFPTYEEWIENFELDNPQPNMFMMQDYHFAKLPVWVNGNAYLNDAKSWKNEKEMFMDSATKAYVNLVEKDGEYFLDTNVYDILKDFTSAQIDSDVLGKAFEPEQRFENPDGSTIHFDTDYFGNRRGDRTLPGPFGCGCFAGNRL